MPTNAAQVDSLRWKKFPVLDDGFVCLVDVMGDDQAVVQAHHLQVGKAEFLRLAEERFDSFERRRARAVNG